MTKGQPYGGFPAPSKMSWQLCGKQPCESHGLHGAKQGCTPELAPAATKGSAGQAFICFAWELAAVNSGFQPSAAVWGGCDTFEINGGVCGGDQIKALSA